ncbi:hypothetical protein D3C73_1224130 [compost metagenome]
MRVSPAVCAGSARRNRLSPLARPHRASRLSTAKATMPETSWAETSAVRSVSRMIAGLSTYRYKVSSGFVSSPLKRASSAPATMGMIKGRLTC